MTSIARALARATYYSAHHAIRLTGDINTAWHPARNGLPYMPRRAAVESVLAANRHRGPTLATRLENFKFARACGLI